MTLVEFASAVGLMRNAASIRFIGLTAAGNSQENHAAELATRYVTVCGARGPVLTRYAVDLFVLKDTTEIEPTTMPSAARPNRNRKVCTL